MCIRDRFCYNAKGKLQWSDKFIASEGVYWVAVSQDASWAASGGLLAHGSGFIRAYNCLLYTSQSFVAGTPTNVQLMVKNSKKFATTGGWGFAQFEDGKPADEALHQSCFPCHQPFKAGDLVFTHYSP